MISLLFALFISFVLSPWFIRKLKHKQVGQVVREDGPESHLTKTGTPTMGGGLILFAATIPSILLMDWTNYFFWSILLVFLGFGALGFMDDYRKIAKKNTKGVSAKGKLLIQSILAFVASFIHYKYTQDVSLVGIPYTKGIYIDIGHWYLAFSVFIIVGASNAVNLTDGLDGLAIGPVMVAAACFAILTYISGNSVMAEYLNFNFINGSGELSIFCCALIGAGMGFLWYNTYPAQVFMGDVGSLPLGAALGAIAVFSKHELLLVIIGGIFVLEAVSVMTQVASFKLTGKRVFKMAPIHHHFELKGWPEPKIIVRFWIISVVLGLIGLLSLKIR